MGDRTVDFVDTSQGLDTGVEDGAGIDRLVLDNVGSGGSSWNFCGSKTLPRSEVVFFFQALIMLTLIPTSFYEIEFFKVSCQDMSFWVSLWSGAVG